MLGANTANMAVATTNATTKTGVLPIYLKKLKKGLNYSYSGLLFKAFLFGYGSPYIIGLTPVSVKSKQNIRKGIYGSSSETQVMQAHRRMPVGQSEMPKRKETVPSRNAREKQTEEAFDLW